MHYSKAPVVEAIIDVRLVYTEEPTIEALESFADRLKDQFPTRHRIHAVQMSVGMSPDGHTQSSKRSGIGVRLSSLKNDRILQVRRSGFTYSHLPQYTNWEVFFGEALSHLETLQKEFNPSGVTRAAVRFINRILIPQGSDVAKYVNIYPQFPADLGEANSGFFMQVAFAQQTEDPSFRVIVNTGIEQAEDPKLMGLMLDIDAFSEGPRRELGEELTSLLKKLRETKNKIFEACITDETRRMIS